jgi:hypothetical protein
VLTLPLQVYDVCGTDHTAIFVRFTQALIGNLFDGVRFTLETDEFCNRIDANLMARLREVGKIGQLYQSRGTDGAGISDMVRRLAAQAPEAAGPRAAAAAATTTTVTPAKQQARAPPRAPAKRAASPSPFVPAALRRRFDPL